MIHEDLADLALAKAEQATKQGYKDTAQTFKKEALDHLNKALKALLTYYPKDCPHIVRVRSKIKSLEPSS